MRTRTVTLTIMVPDNVQDWALEEIISNSIPDELECGVTVISQDSITE